MIGFDNKPSAAALRPTLRDWTPDVMTEKKTVMTSEKIPVGRPKLSVDFAIVLRMRDREKMGWSRMAQAYREITGKYISRDTIKRRYLEAKAR